MTDLLRVAWNDLFSQPVRSIASITGLLFAVLAALLVISAASLSERANQEYIERTYGREATVRVVPRGEASSAVEQEDFETFLNSAGINRISMDIYISGSVVLADQSFPADASIVSSTYPDVGSVEIIGGSFPQETADSSAMRLVVSRSLVESMGLSPDEAVGTAVLFIPGTETQNIDPRTTSAYPAVIEAVANRIGPTSDSRGSLVVANTLPSQLRSVASTRWLIHVSPGDVLYLEELVRTYSRIHRPSDNPLETIRLDVGDLFRPLIDQQKNTSSVVFVIVLLLGGFGIAGIGVTSVRERKQELGVRRSFGATSGKIFALVMIQISLDVCIALALAFPLARLAIELFARQMIIPTLPVPQELGIPASAAVVTIISAATVGIIAGLLPAWTASKTSIIKALSV